MSIRIYELSKKIGMENKELITLLNKRGHEVKSASSTVDNISADSLIEEYQKSADKNVIESSPVKKETAKETSTVAAKSSLPQGVIVKSKEEVDREREKKNDSDNLSEVGIKNVSQPKSSVPEEPVSVSAVKTGVESDFKSQQPINPPMPVLPPSVVKQSERDGNGEEQGGHSELRVLQIKPPIVVRDFAVQLGLKPFRLISELMEMNIFASMNQVIDEDVATKIAEKHGHALEVRHRGEAQDVEKEVDKEKPKKADESELLEPRPAIVCILGHVDHGKTTLLDTLRKSNVVAGEAGGITQHIGAYQVENKGHKITFIDTPGHAAFSNMRLRGANTTDIAILVVAADDGFMPQTDEALGHAKAAGVPIIVAINKIDVKGANIDRVKTQMQERGIISEDWGGETIAVSISALKGENLDELLDMILLQAEIMELKANPKCPAEGVLLESQMEQGLGPTASLLIEKGTIKVGDSIICGSYYCKLRAMTNDQGQNIKSAGPATPVKGIGWSGAPESGSGFKTVKNEKDAKRKAEVYATALKKVDPDKIPLDEPASVENLFAAIAQTQKKTFRLVVKADVFGTAEALANSLNEIQSEKVDIDIVQVTVGLISKSDVLMASAAEAAIAGFNVSMENGVSSFAKHHNIVIYIHDVIYELIDLIKESIVDILEPELRENKVGAAEVRQVFPVAKGAVAGCLVTEGSIGRDSTARLLRNGNVEIESKIDTLKRFKDDATQVRAGFECGIGLIGYSDYKEGDIIECFEIEKIRSSL